MSKTSCAQSNANGRIRCVSLYHKFMVLPLEIFSETFGQWTKVWSIDLDIEAFLFCFHSSGSKLKNCIFQKSFRFVKVYN